MHSQFWMAIISGMNFFERKIVSSVIRDRSMFTVHCSPPKNKCPSLPNYHIILLNVKTPCLLNLAPLSIAYFHAFGFGIYHTAYAFIPSNQKYVSMLMGMCVACLYVVSLITNEENRKIIIASKICL